MLDSPVSLCGYDKSPTLKTSKGRLKVKQSSLVFSKILDGLTPSTVSRHQPRRRPTLHPGRLLRQSLPKGTYLSVYGQEEPDEIAESLNTRPRQTLDWRTALEVYAELLKTSVAGPSTLQ